jgi:hypothetical protein
VNRWKNIVLVYHGVRRKGSTLRMCAPVKLRTLPRSVSASSSTTSRKEPSVRKVNVVAAKQCPPCMGISSIVAFRVTSHGHGVFGDAVILLLSERSDPSPPESSTGLQPSLNKDVGKVNGSSSPKLDITDAHMSSPGRTKDNGWDKCRSRKRREKQCTKGCEQTRGGVTGDLGNDCRTLSSTLSGKSVR